MNQWKFIFVATFLFKFSNKSARRPLLHFAVRLSFLLSSELLSSTRTLSQNGNSSFQVIQIYLRIWSHWVGSVWAKKDWDFIGVVLENAELGAKNRPRQNLDHFRKKWIWGQKTINGSECFPAFPSIMLPFDLIWFVFSSSP